MPSRPPLAPGLYERLITNALKVELDALEREGTSVVHSAPIDPAEAHATLARHIEAVVARALRGLPEKVRKARQPEIANRIIELLARDAETRRKLPQSLDSPKVDCSEVRSGHAEVEVQ